MCVLSGVWDRGWTTFACRENVIPLPCCFKISDNAQRVNRANSGYSQSIWPSTLPCDLLVFPPLSRSSGLPSLIWVSLDTHGCEGIRCRLLLTSSPDSLSPFRSFTPPTSHTQRHWPHAPTGSIFQTLKETHLNYAWVYEAVYLNMTWCRGHWGFSRTLTW